MSSNFLPGTQLLATDLNATFGHHVDCNGYDQMTGPLFMWDGDGDAGDGTLDYLQGTCRGWVREYVSAAIYDTWINPPSNIVYLPLTGGTITGPLTVNANTYLYRDTWLFGGVPPGPTFGSPTAQPRLRWPNGSVGPTGTDGGNMWMCGSSVEIYNGYGVSTTCPAQKVPQGMYGIVLQGRDGSISTAGTIISRAAGVNQAHQLGLFRFSRSNTQEVTLAALGNIGALSITDGAGAPGAGASGGTGWNVNDRLYDGYGSTYTVLTVAGGVIQTLRMDTIPYFVGTLTNPIALTAAPGFTGTGASVNLTSSIPNKMILTVGGELNLNGTTSNTVRADPTTALGIATKQYADKMLPLAGGTCTGTVNFARVGFNGTVGPVKPTVTGAKGSNAALASLMTALAAYGLVTDSTTA